MGLHQRFPVISANFAKGQIWVRLARVKLTARMLTCNFAKNLNTR